MEDLRTFGTIRAEQGGEPRIVKTPNAHQNDLSRVLAGGALQSGGELARALARVLLQMAQARLTASVGSGKR